MLSLVAWAPLLYPGLVQTHSGLGAVYDALAASPPLSAWLPVYATPGDGPLATWLLVILKTVIGPLAALKLLYAASFMLSGIGMFVLARRIWGQWPALVAGAVYMLIPYRLVLVYVRGALAESLLLAGAPFLFVVLHEAMRSPRRRNLAAVALLSAALSLLNFGLGLLTVVVALLWSATQAQTSGVPDNAGQALPQTSEVSPTPHTPLPIPYTLYPIPYTLYPAFSALAGLLIALLVLLPSGGRFLANLPGWNDHFVYFFQLFSPSWGFGESVSGWQDGMSFQLGLAPVALAIVALWGAYETDNAAQRRAVLMLGGLVCLILALTLGFSEPVWRLLRLSALAAYPWQLLGLAALPLALLAGAAAQTLAPSAKPVSLTVLAVLLGATVLASYSFLAPRFTDTADLPDLNHLPVAQLGDDVLLLDARLEKEARPGGSVHLTLIWQALRQPSADYTTFAHLVDAQSTMRGQQDMRPHNDQKPTNTWLRGEVVRDEIVIPVNPDAPPGEYRVSVGMYLLATMDRLPVAGTRQSEVVLGPVRVQ